MPVGKDNNEGVRSFEEAAKARQHGIFVEFWDFVKHNKKWWLLPIIIALAIFGLLTVLSTTAVAPFIYTLF